MPIWKRPPDATSSAAACFAASTAGYKGSSVIVDINLSVVVAPAAIAREIKAFEHGT